jgi:hypothetical protein
VGVSATGSASLRPAFGQPDIFKKYKPKTSSQQRHQRHGNEVESPEGPPTLGEEGGEEKSGRERVTGIEPAFSAWEADVLPLNYTRVDGRNR